MRVSVQFGAGCLMAAALLAQGLPPALNPPGLNPPGLNARDKAEDYPAHATLGNFTLAADYLVHTLPVREGPALVADDYLVIEIAVYGPRHSRIDLSSGNFTLVVNKKTELTPESAGIVAASIKDPALRARRPKVDLSGGAASGNGSVVFGPPQVERFPGDPTVRSPRPNPGPEQNPAGLERQQEVPLEQQVQSAALASGEIATPCAGLIFFPYGGRTQKIKILELLYDGPAGKLTLKLQ